MDRTPPSAPDDPGGSSTASSKITHQVPLGTAPAAAPPTAPAKATAAPAKALRVEPEPVPMAEAEGPTGAAKITAFGKEERHEEVWSRTPNVTGKGAIHVKTFHSKITADALIYMDQTINEWLDSHPEYEVKFVNSTVGILSGKLKEPAVICQVWV
ncbi:MAG: hypothetical protein JSV91_07820 [Phycisphaerales bacterium]|nr:MAG: hypothetical protein JSV91_07820 [Phycisphaerales bacterium]